MNARRETEAAPPPRDDRRAAEFTRHLDEIRRRYLPMRDGVPASYIPELAKADPDWFGIAVVTADGQVFEVGDADQPFTIQSISKPFVYGLALEDHGRDAVLARSASSRRAKRSTPSSSTRPPTARSTRWSTPAPSPRPT